MKKNIIFIPGLCFGQNLWLHQIEHLQDNYRCQVYIPKHNQLNVVIEDLFDCLQQPSCIIAHSSIAVGIALAAAAKDPQKKLISSIICFPGWVRPDEYTQDFLKLSIDNMRTNKFDEFKSILRQEVLGKDPELIDKFASEVKAIQDQVEIEHAITQAELLLNELDVTSILPNIKQACLVSCNLKNDPWFSSQNAIELSNSLDNATLIFLDSIGHIAPITDTTAVNALIDLWLQLVV